MEIQLIWYGNTDIDNNTKNTYLIDIFSYENLAMEYNFQTGSASLYLKKDENEYEILYERYIRKKI